MDTWGIPSGTFLIGYVALLAVAFLLVQPLRIRALRDRDESWSEPSVDVYEIAMVNDGPRLAIAAAAVQLRDASALEVGARDGALAVTGPLPPAAHPLERRLYADVGESVRRPERRLRHDPAISAMHDRLTDLGLVPTHRQRVRVRLLTLLLVPVVVLGLARVAAGSADGKPVGFILALTGLAAVLAVAWAIDVPHVTPRGEKLLARLRADDPTRASLPLAGSIALSGAPALWAADAGLAAAVGLPRESGGGAGGGGDGGGCGGGCGG